jgi:hypothetical protein
MIIDNSVEYGYTPSYFCGDTLFTPFERPHGLPIGNQTSQFFANVYLNPLDHYIKEILKQRGYIRYVDDFVLFADDKETLWEILSQTRSFLQSQLRLVIPNAKAQVSPTECGTDFLGYRIFPDHRRLRRSSGVRFGRRLRQMQRAYQEGKTTPHQIIQRIASWIGHAKHADTYRLRHSILTGVAFRRASPDMAPRW